MSVNESVQPAITVEGVSYLYHRATVLRDVSFTIPAGDYVGIIGPNGGGKTTMTKLLLGLLVPSKGKITLFGTTLTKAKRQYGIGYVPQRVATEAVNFPASVIEVIESGLTSPGKSGQSVSRKAAVKKAMDMTGIISLADRRIDELSGGERQRVFIARALVRMPKLLILDEPTVGVDIAAREQFAHFLEQLNRVYGMTILLVSHDIEAIGKQVKHVLCLNQSLVCHLCADDFIKGDYLQKMYGSSATVVHHHH